MTKLLVLLLIFLLIPFALAQGDLNSAESLTIDSKIIFPVRFVPSGGPMDLDYLHIDFSWIPVNDYRQTLLSASSEPVSEKKSDSMFFEIKSMNDFDVIVDFKTKTTSQKVKVKEKIPFPIINLDPELISYTKETNLIDINNDIRNLAASIAKDEDDLYVVVFKLADWVNTNIEYNLSTTTSTATLKSSWVLEERQGVCDELSNLFVSMVRSLGIPARVVSGITYTDSELFNYNWGAHGWTEVYFPGYGWIPFDPTYNQLGYVDATHITMNRYADEDRYNTKYEWRGRGFDLDPGLQQIQSKVLNQGPQKATDATIKIDLLRDIVDFGSYNVVSAKITNKRDYYVTKSFDISRTEGLTNIDESMKDILLKPNEVKYLYWILKVDDDLRNNYIYTFPITIFSQSGESVESSFQSAEQEEFISKKVASSYIQKEEELVENMMTCTTSKESVYLEEEFDVKCEFTDPSMPEEVTLCIRNVCEKVKKSDAVISFDINDSGFQTLVVEASAQGFKESAFFSINAIDRAIVEINDIKVPVDIGFSESAFLKFNIKRVGSGLPQNLNIKVSHELFRKEWKMDFLPDTQEFNLEFSGKDLKSKSNVLKIIVDYEDAKGEKYTASKDVKIYFKELSFFEKFQLWLNDFELWVSNIFS